MTDTTEITGLTVEKINSITWQYGQKHGTTDLDRLVATDTTLHVPNDMLTNVQAIDPTIEPVPPFVERTRIKKRMILDGTYAGFMDAIEADASTDGQIALMQWQDELMIRRDSEAAAALKPALSYSDSDVDDLFRRAIKTA